MKSNHHLRLPSKASSYNIFAILSFFCLFSFQASAQVFSINSKADFKGSPSSTTYDAKMDYAATSTKMALNSENTSKYAEKNAYLSVYSNNEKMADAKVEILNKDSEFLNEFAKEELGLKATTTRRKD